MSSDFLTRKRRDLYLMGKAMMKMAKSGAPEIDSLTNEILDDIALVLWRMNIAHQLWLEEEDERQRVAMRRTEARLNQLPKMALLSLLDQMTPAEREEVLTRALKARENAQANTQA